MSKSIVREKSKDFAVRIVHLYQYLKETKKEFVMSKQLLRSGTSIGANLSEQEFAISDADYLSKTSIALKEGAETIYWFCQEDGFPQKLCIMKVSKSYLLINESRGMIFIIVKILKLLSLTHCYCAIYS